MEKLNIYTVAIVVRDRNRCGWQWYGQSGIEWPYFFGKNHDTDSGGRLPMESGNGGCHFRRNDVQCHP